MPTGGTIILSITTGFSSRQHVRDREAVDVGVEEPDLLAAAASAAAMFVVSDDLPTPPLPDAIAITRVRRRELLAARLDAAAELRRQLAALLRGHDVEVELDGVDAGEPATCSRT